MFCNVAKPQNTHHVLMHQDVGILIHIDAQSFYEGLPSSISVILKNKRQDILTQILRSTEESDQRQTLETFLTSCQQKYLFGPDLYGLDFIFHIQRLYERKKINFP